MLTTKGLTSIITVLVKTDEDVINLQLLFSKFQQKSKTVKKQNRQVLMYYRGCVNKPLKKIIIYDCFMNYRSMNYTSQKPFLTLRLSNTSSPELDLSHLFGQSG